MTNEDKLDKDGVTTVDPATAFGEAAIELMGKASVKWIRLSALKTDPRVQRPLFLPRSVKIKNKFNWAAFGLPAVSCRDDGDNITLDGMHRLQAVRLLPAGLRGGEDPEIQCETWDGLTIEQEAQIFVLRNATEKVPAIALFQVRVNGKDQNAIAIKEMLGTYGWTVRTDRSAGSLNAIDTVERCYNTNAWATTMAIETITTSWPNRPIVAVDSRIVRGLFLIFKRYEGRIDKNRLVARLGTRNIPDALITQGSHHASMNRGTSVAKGVAFMILTEYNKAPGINVEPRI